MLKAFRQRNLARTENGGREPSDGETAGSSFDVFTLGLLRAANTMTLRNLPDA